MSLEVLRRYEVNVPPGLYMGDSTAVPPATGTPLGEQLPVGESVVEVEADGSPQKRSKKIGPSRGVYSPTA